MSPRIKHDKFCIICGKLIPKGSGMRKVCPPSVVAKGYAFGSKCAKKHQSNLVARHLRKKYNTDSEYRRQKLQQGYEWKKNNPEKRRAQKRRYYRRRNTPTFVAVEWDQLGYDEE